MEMKEYSELMVEKYDEIIEMMIAEEKEDPSFDMDLYLEPNGDLYWFSNPGGNSWLDVDHVVVCTINHENWDYRKGTEEFDEYDEWYSDCTSRLDARIESQKKYEKMLEDLYE